MSESLWVKFDRRQGEAAAVYHFAVDSTGLAINADFIFCGIIDNTDPETTLLGAVLEIILKGCLQNYTVKTKQAYV